MNDFSGFHVEGLIIALVTFMIIGIFHPIVIHAEYRWGTGCWLCLTSVDFFSRNLWHLPDR